MSCNSPFLAKDNKGNIRYVPCKRCMGCRNDRREDFTNRLMLDYNEYGHIGSFITLTYRNETLPILLPEGSAIVGKYFKYKPSGTLYKPDVKNFFDNLNHKIKKKYGWSIKYICSGEYGDGSNGEQRPHYHAIVLGLPCTDRKLLLDTWKKGIIDIAPVTHADIRYTLTYIDKQIFGNEFLYENFGDYEPTFGLFSKGLGQKHYNNHINEYDELGRFYTSDKKYIQLNQYYCNKYGKLKSSKMYPKTVIEFAKKNKIDNLQKAFNLYCKLREEKIIKSERARHHSIHDTTKDFNYNFNK